MISALRIPIEQFEHRTINDQHPLEPISTEFCLQHRAHSVTRTVQSGVHRAARPRVLCTGREETDGQTKQYTSRREGTEEESREREGRSMTDRGREREREGWLAAVYVG